VNTHDYNALDVAEDWGWSSLALVDGETVGAVVSVLQCQRCKLVKVVAYKDDVHITVVRYYIDCQGTLVEPECRVRTQ
jgi:hypothetical protein